VLLVLVSFKNVEGDIGSALVGLELDFLLGKEADYNIDFFIRLKTTDHWFNCKDFLSFLLDREVEFNGVLTLVLKEKRLFFGLANANSFEIKNLVKLHLFIKSDVEAFSIENHIFIVLFYLKTFCVANF